MCFMRTMSVKTTTNFMEDLFMSSPFKTLVLLKAQFNV